MPITHSVRPRLHVRRKHPLHPGWHHPDHPRLGAVCRAGYHQHNDDAEYAGRCGRDNQKRGDHREVHDQVTKRTAPADHQRAKEIATRRSSSAGELRPTPCENRRGTSRFIRLVSQKEIIQRAKCIAKCGRMKAHIITNPTGQHRSSPPGDLVRGGIAAMMQLVSD